MAEAKEKWDEVGERFNELGRSLKGRFDANTAFGVDEREKVNDALRQLTDALDAGFTTIGETFRDPDDARRDEERGFVDRGRDRGDAARRLRRDQASLNGRRRIWTRPTDLQRSRTSRP